MVNNLVISTSTFNARGGSTKLIIPAVALSLLVLATTSHGISTVEITENASPAVVTIIVYDITGAEKGQGSGFFVDDSGLIVTNAHVVKDAYSAGIFSESNYYDRTAILGFDEKTDLALLAVDAVGERYLELELDYQLRPGEQVIAIGNPLGFEKTVSDGLISAIRHYGDSEIIQTTVPISPGSSGGPLLNMEGKVIGVTSAMAIEGQNLNFAVSVNSLRGLISKTQQPKLLHPAKSKVWFRWLLSKVTWVVVTLIALAFGGGWWIIGLVILAVSLGIYVFKKMFSFALCLLRPFKKKSSPVADYGSSTDSGVYDYPPDSNKATSDRTLPLLDDNRPVRRKIEQLRKLISYHQRKYYIDNDPEITDLEYDRLKTQLESLEQTHPELIPTDPPVQLSSVTSDILFYCWKCGTQLRSHTDNSGGATKCLGCGAELTIPNLSGMNEDKLVDLKSPDSNKRKRILIVDDNQNMASLISDILRMHGDYEILTAEDGEEGLQTVRTQSGHIDLITTDCRHAKLDGISMAKIIKQEYPKIPIVMLSGFHSAVKSQLPEGLFFEARPKPVKVEELLRIVDAALLSSEET